MNLLRKQRSQLMLIWFLSRVLFSTALIGAASCSSNGICDDRISGLGVNGSLGEGPTIKGKISEWGNGVGYMLEVRLEPTDSLLTAAPISSSGEFAVTLPENTIINSMIKETSQKMHEDTFGEDCSGCIYSVPDRIRYARIVFLAKKGSSVFSVGYGRSGPPAPPFRVVNFVYVDRTASSNGAIVCRRNGFTSRWDKDYKFESGWNTALTIADTNAAEQYTVTYTSPPPPDVLWLSSPYLF